MKKVIAKTVYDTEVAELVHKYTQGNFGEPEGYEEILFRMPEGACFIYGRGGEASPYPEEKITRIAKNKVQAWIDEH